MSTQRTEQKRDTGAAKNRGRFAVDQLAGNGVELMQEETTIAAPAWGEARHAELEADVAAKAQSRRFAADSTRLLREQGITARRDLAVAATQREAAAAGAELAEVDFMCDTADLEEELAVDDIALAGARVEVDADAGAAIAECVRRRDEPGIFAQKRVAELIHALDLETDEGAGHIAWHPFASDARTETVRGLEDNLDALPHDPQVPVWTERLLQLKDPLRVRRVQIQARRSPTPGTLAQLDVTLVAQKDNEGLTNTQPGDREYPRAPRR